MTRTTTWTGITDGTESHKLCLLLHRLKFTQAAAKYIIADGFDEQEEFEILTDDQVHNLISNCRKPGGGEDGTIVSTGAENYLKLFVWGLKHQLRISRTVDLDGIDTDWCRSMLHQKTLEDNWTTTIDTLTDSDYPKCDANNWPRTFEAIQALLDRVRGRSGRLLSYVIRPQILPKEEYDDDTANYTSFDKEVIARAPIIDPDGTFDDDAPDLELSSEGPFTPEFADDMTLVWDVLYKVVGPKPDWVHAKSTKTTKNGRYAYFLLKKMVMGEQYISRQVQALEKRVVSLTYHGEKKQHDMKRYVQHHKECHALAEDLTGMGWGGIDDMSKVRHFMNGIKCTTVDAPKSTIISNSMMQADFDECARHFLDFIEATPAIQYAPSQNISEVRGERRDGARRPKGSRSAGIGVESEILAAMPRIKEKYFRNGPKSFVPTTDYEAMNESNRQAVWRVRAELNGNARTPKGTGNAKEVTKLKRTVASLSRANAQLEKEMAQNSDEASIFDENDVSFSGGDQKKKKSNKNNPALGRQKKDGEG